MTIEYKENWCKDFVANKLMTLFEMYSENIPNYDMLEKNIVSDMMKTLKRTKDKDIYYQDILKAFQKALHTKWT